MKRRPGTSGRGRTRTCRGSTVSAGSACSTPPPRPPPGSRGSRLLTCRRNDRPWARHRDHAALARHIGRGRGGRAQQEDGQDPRHRRLRVAGLGSRDQPLGLITYFGVRALMRSKNCPGYTQGEHRAARPAREERVELERRAARLTPGPPVGRIRCPADAIATEIRQPSHDSSYRSGGNFRRAALPTCSPVSWAACSPRTPPLRGRSDRANGEVHTGCSPRVFTSGSGPSGVPSAWQPGRTRAWMRPIRFPVSCPM